MDQKDLGLSLKRLIFKIQKQEKGLWFLLEPISDMRHSKNFFWGGNDIGKLSHQKEV